MYYYALLAKFQNKKPNGPNIDICGVGQVSHVRHRNCIRNGGINSVISSLNND